MARVSDGRQSNLSARLGRVKAGNTMSLEAEKQPSPPLEKPRQDPPVALAVVDPSTGSDSIQAFSSQQNFEAAQRMAHALSKSSLVPKEYQGNLPNCLIALELAGRVGVSVFAAMQNLDIIHGRPSWRSSFLVACVNSTGRFSPLRFRFQGVEGTDDWGCRAYATDSTGEECVGTLITIGLAKAEGWYGKNGSKWRTMPEQMLRYRAAAFWSRVYAPEVSLGMHTSDELGDIESREMPGNVKPGNPMDLEARVLSESPAPESPAATPPSEPENAAPMREPGEDDV